MKYFSMFSGIGGFELGIQNAYRGSFGGKQADTERDERQGLLTKEGQDTSTPERRPSKRPTDEFDQRPLCIGYSEIDKYATKVYERNFSGHRNFGDATAIRADELPDFDLLVGGFPCQAFSVAGKRLGFDDTRGTLFFDIARILKHKRPGHLVLENVKGLLSHDSGKTFQTILKVLTDLGYRVEWQVLNSKDFGVPQNRERIYIVGHLGNGCGREVFPITGTNQEDTRIIGQDVAYTIDANYAKGTNTLEKSRRSIVQINQPRHSNDRVYSAEGVSPTLNTMQGGNRQPFVSRQPLRFLDRNQKNIEGDYAFTVDASQTSGVRVDTKIRRLTPKECERLQGFPDDWTSLDVEGNPVSDTQRYKMCGNAVTVNVVQAVMEGLKACL